MIPRRKFSEILKRGVFQNPCQIIPLVEFVFNKIAETDSRTCIFAEKKFPPRIFSCGYIRIFSAFSVRSNVNFGFGKIAECALEGRTLLKRCYTIDFLKNVLLKQLVFGTFSTKNLWRSLLIVDVHYEHYRLATLLK